MHKQYNCKTINGFYNLLAKLFYQAVCNIQSAWEVPFKVYNREQLLSRTQQATVHLHSVIWLNFAGLSR